MMRAEIRVMDFTIITLAGGFLISLCVGVLTGLFGVGGGFLMTPLLIILLRVPAAIAIGTDLAVITINSMVGILKRRGTGTVDVKLALLAATGALLGVIGGQRLMVYVRDLPPIVVQGRSQNTLEYGVMLAFVVVLSWVAAFMYLDLRVNAGQAPAKRVGLFARINLGPRVAFASLEEPRIAVLPLVLAGALIGALTGLMGIGGGVLWLPVLVYLVGQRAAKAAGTSLLLVWLSSLLGTALNITSGNVNGWLCVVMVAGGAAGTVGGTHLGLRLTGPRLRLGFIFVLLAAIFLIGGRLAVMTFGGRAP